MAVQQALATAEGIAGWVNAYFEGIGEDQRHISQLQVFEQKLFHAEGQDGNALHAPFNHATNRGLHTFGIVPGGG